MLLSESCQEVYSGENLHGFLPWETTISCGFNIIARRRKRGFS